MAGPVCFTLCSTRRASSPGLRKEKRANLEFLIALRNQIEHRQVPELNPGLYGECQGALLNLETLLPIEFGGRYALSEQLAVSLQLSGLISADKRKAVGKLSLSSQSDWVMGHSPAARLNGWLMRNE